MEPIETELHIPVLLEESIAGLAVADGDIIVDGTFGGGGHSRALLARYGSRITLICVDLDEAARDRFAIRMADHPHVVFVHANFKDADLIMASAKVAHVHKVLLDLGTSTFQLLADTRGFSFNSDAPLSMAFSEAGSHTTISAYDIANEWEESSIADIIYAYGQDRRSRKIARAIVEARAQAPITTARMLADIISARVPRQGKIHPATKTFQAFRIAVNDELGVLTEALNNWWEALLPGGRIAVITFHSLEDRIVKQWMKAKTNERVITKKPIAPDRSELRHNPRSRSAKLRIIEKVTTATL